MYAHSLLRPDSTVAPYQEPGHQHAANSCHVRSHQVVHIPSMMFQFLQSSHRARRICAFCAFWLFAVFWIVVSLISGSCIPGRYKLVTMSQNICLHKSCSQNTWYSAFQGTVLRSCSPQLWLGVPLLSIRLCLGPELDQRWCRILTDRMSRPVKGFHKLGFIWRNFCSWSISGKSWVFWCRQVAFVVGSSMLHVNVRSCVEKLSASWNRTCPWQSSMHLMCWSTVHTQGKLNTCCCAKVTTHDQSSGHRIYECFG